MVAKERHNFNVRIQPLSGTPLASVVDWFNAMPTSEKNRRVSELLLMTCLPLAMADAGATPSEIERCYWEAEQLWGHYKFTLKQMLQIKNSPTREYPSLVKEDDEPVQQQTTKSQLFETRTLKSANSLFDGLG
ncbi:MAG: hypothetical protein HC820_00260 [Hydrococcus sp. RM1_1_31]|nr:hypothetical protein [Hydrococcus sp. RM1_1_31]